MATLSVRLLGPFQVTLDGEAVTGFATDKGRALLAYLVVEADRPHRRESLAGLLWPDYLERSARTSLRSALANLRQVIGDAAASPPYLDISRQTIQLNREGKVWSDVAAFAERLESRGAPGAPEDGRKVGLLEEAVELYRGPFLEGFSLADSPAFEEWALLTREHFQRQACTALRACADHHEKKGAFQRALVYARREVDLDPWQEAAQRQLMRLLALNDQRSAALAQYEGYRQLLATELGLEPSEEIKKTFELLLRGELPTGPPPAKGARDREPRVVGECPYRGLAAFREADAPFFFGREDFTERLFQAVHERPLVAVIVGSSGSGKSSAVYAGLLPQLRSQGAGAWLITDCRPGAQPFHALAGALVLDLEPELSETDRLIETGKLAQALRRGDVSLYHVIMRALEKSAYAKRMLLLVDQFEELYTLCPDHEERSQFVNKLLAAIEYGEARRGSPFVLLLTLRADFMGQALSHRPLTDLLQRTAHLLGPMSREELRAAIEQPAEKQGAALEVGLVERLLDDVGEEPGKLPLLEFALTLLWGRLDDGWMTHAAYKNIGRVDGALARHADQVYAALSEEERESARQVLLQLVQPGEGTADTRRLATRAELGDDHWDLVQHLANQRLVVTGRDAAGNQTVEVVHEALIQRWGQLREWMEADRAFRTWQERLRVALRGWEASDGDEGALLRGGPLAEAEDWLAERGEQLSPAEITYIQAGLALRQRRQVEREQRRRRTILALAGGLVAALILVMLASLQWQRAEGEEHEALLQASIGLGSQALLELDGSFPERAVLLALEAVEQYPYTWQAERALGQAVLANRVRAILPHAAELVTARWSPDGRCIATASRDSTVRVWDAASGQELFNLDHSVDFIDVNQEPDIPLSADWSAADNRLLTITDSGVGREWDLADGAAEPKVRFHPGRDEFQGWISAMWSPSGDRLIAFNSVEPAEVRDGLTGSLLYTVPGEIGDQLSNGVPRVWAPAGDRIAIAEPLEKNLQILEAASGEMLLTLPDGSRDCMTLAWSPDGMRILTGHRDGAVRVWQVASGEQLLSFSAHEAGVTGAVWSPEGERFATGGTDSQLKVWDAATGEQILNLSGQAQGIVDVDWSPSGEHIVTAGNDGNAIVWDLDPALLTVRGSVLTSEVAWSPDGEQLACSVEGRAVQVWDVATGAPLLTLNHEGVIAAVAWSPDSKRLLTASSMLATANPGGTIRVWDAISGEQLLEFAGHQGWGPTSATWSPDGQRVLSTGWGGTARVWDPVSGAQLLRLSGMAFGYAKACGAWSPDGRQLVTTSLDGTVAVWDADSGAVLRVLPPGDPTGPMIGVTWSPDGRRIVAFGSDGTGHIWDAAAGEQLLTLSGHRSPVHRIRWSPAGDRFVSSSADGTTRVWELETGVELVRYEVRGQNVADWSPDGTRIAISSSQGTLQVFPAWGSLQELIAHARECCVTRELTPEEREQFGLPER